MIFFLAAAAGTATDKPATSGDDPSKLVCRMEARTGSHFLKKVCHTQQEWAEMAESARRGARELIDSPKINNTDEH